MSHAVEMVPYVRPLISGGNGNFVPFLYAFFFLLFLQPPYAISWLKTDFSCIKEHRDWKWPS